ncbi:MAG: DUF6152 family protein [Gammaproteobacteria bacterium]|nr:DUF6152 family protein [Gammaproteobacteria bacterium]MDH3508334.1 DUF6152 family protein [Gammaproteobacteria bacterium]
MLRSIGVAAISSTLGITFLAAPGLAHHATAPAYDLGEIIELTGEITAVSWRNPHIHLTLRSSSEGGTTAMWDLETNSVSVVSRYGLSPDLIAPGTQVRVAGSPGRVKEHSLWLTNVLLDDGREVLFGSAYLPRWSQNIVGADTRGAITADLTGALGIFRVWTNIGVGTGLWNSSYPFTPEAAAVRAAFDPVGDDPTLNCALKGMPLIMEQPYPMEFVDEGDEILLRLEEYDTVRRIAMTDHESARARPPSILGNSTGRWDSGVLVVETTGVDYPWFNKTGIPQSVAVHIMERFELNADGSRLQYEMTVTDPATFTEPVVLTKSWGYRPNDEVRPYECAPDN